MTHHARSYAEHCHEQNFEAAVDALRKLIAEEPEFFRTLTVLLNKNNRAAAAFLASLDKHERTHAVEWIVPFARIGLSAATFAMEDKYGGAA